MGRTGIGVIWLCVCCVIQTSLGQLVNVARGKTYNQSSYQNNDYPSSNAANGNTGGDYNSNNCIHTSATGSDNEPWWQVDLGRNYPVYSVTVWARTELIQRHLTYTGGNYNLNNCIHTGAAGTDFEPWWQVDLGRKYPVYNVTVMARTGFVKRLYPLNITVDGQQCVRATSGSRQQSLNCTSPISGRVVRLTRDYRDTGKNKTLNLCEVQIWSTCQAGDYNNGTACVPCSSTCKKSQCNSDTGRCDSFT